MSQFRIPKFLVLLLILPLLPLFAGCFVERPGVTDPRRAIASMPHTGAMLAECTSCHAALRPLVPVRKMDHTYSEGAGDCAPCHAQTAGTMWSGGTFTHATPGRGLPSVCSRCHAPQLPVTVVSKMSHSVILDPTSTPPTLLDSTTYCGQCHVLPGVAWSGGLFHSVAASNTWAIKTCHDCHSTPVGLMGAQSSPPGFDHARGGSGDCYSCHMKVPSNLGVSWAGGFYDHTPTPSLCKDCHQSTLQLVGGLAGPIGTPAFDHRQSSASGDCVYCHMAVPANIGVTWKGGQFSHTPLPSTCKGCHTAPTTAVGVIAATATRPSSQFVHAGFMGARDCNSCHLGVAGDVNGWKTPVALYGNPHNPMPTTCKDCHSPTVGHIAIGTSDCKACHTVAVVGASWGTATGGVDHSGVSACTNCHYSSSAPQLVVKTPSAGTGVSRTLTEVISVAERAKIPGRFFNHGLLGASPFPTRDCEACHLLSGAGQSWAMPHIKFHGAGISMSRCDSCHDGLIAAATRAAGTATASYTFAHSAANLGTADCTACHSGTAGNATGWMNGQFPHSGITKNCKNCHGAPTGTVLFAAANNCNYRHGTHTSKTPDCSNCHAASGAGTTWNNGSCLSCHRNRCN